MKGNKNKRNHNRFNEDRFGNISIVGSFVFSIFSALINDLFQLSKMFSGKLPIRYANLRV